MLVDEAERDPVLAQHVIPDARLLTVPAAGHMVLIEQPQIGSAAITDFIDEIERR
ncbi:MAG: alpha/beta fold hydrolase [Dermatophilaceae bacterium]